VKYFRRLSLIAVAVLLVASLGFTQAQDDIMKITCDSDLILSLYTAEYHFNFAAVHDAMKMAPDAMAMVDLAAFEKGQFAPLFDTMMGMMDEMPAMMSEEAMESLMSAMSMDIESLDSMMMEMSGEGMAALVPPVVADEAPECTALRDELRHFYTALAYSAQMMQAGM
jgi:hypothetical protein